MRYNKLVRDKIPEIIRKDKKKSVTYIADDSEYWMKLKEKLIEEVSEFSENSTEEEMADILEVIDAICEFKGFDKEGLKKIKLRKRFKRGGFKERIILESVEET